MTRRACGAVLGLLLGLGGGCRPGARDLSEAHAVAMRDSVAATLGLFRRYAAGGQWDSLALLYDDDPGFRWVENGLVRYRSREDIRQALAGLPPGTRVETTHQDTEITPVAPGVASVVTRFQTRFVDSAGAGFPFDGAITMTLVHREHGWRALGGHSSSPQRRR